MAGVAMLLGGCGETVIQQPVSASQLHGKTALMLDSTRIPPLTEAVFEAFLSRAEQRLAGSPVLGGVKTRGAIRQAIGGDRSLARAYALYSDTFSVLGLPDRETSHRLARAFHVELLAMAQLVLLECPGCDIPIRLGAQGALVDALAGDVKWRFYTVRNLGDTRPETISAEADVLLGELQEAFDDSLRLKWHRLRFDRLARRTPG